LIIANSERLGYFESVKTLRREAHRDVAIFNSKENQLPQESWYREVSGGFLRGRDNSWGFLLGGDSNGMCKIQTRPLGHRFL
jgi:hypothetical protein